MSEARLTQATDHTTVRFDAHRDRGPGRASRQRNLLACARSSSRSRCASVRSGSASVRSGGRSGGSSFARSSSRSRCASVRSGSSRCRSGGSIASRRSSLVAALVARSKCNSCQQGCYEEGFLHDHVLLWLKVSNSANNTGNVPQHRPEPLVETHCKSVNLPYGLAGNYRHFRIDRRQIRGQYVVFLIQALF